MTARFARGDGPLLTFAGCLEGEAHGAKLLEQVLENATASAPWRVFRLARRRNRRRGRAHTEPRQGPESVARLRRMSALPSGPSVESHLGI